MAVSAVFRYVSKAIPQLLYLEAGTTLALVYPLRGPFLTPETPKTGHFSPKSAQKSAILITGWLIGVFS
jgi:hypothetical protein